MCHGVVYVRRYYYCYCCYYDDYYYYYCFCNVTPKNCRFSDYLQLPVTLLEPGNWRMLLDF